MVHAVCHSYSIFFNLQQVEESAKAQEADCRTIDEEVAIRILPSERCCVLEHGILSSLLSTSSASRHDYKIVVMDIKYQLKQTHQGIE